MFDLTLPNLATSRFAARPPKSNSSHLSEIAEIEPLRVEGPDAPLPSRDFSFSPLCDPPITEAVSSGRKALRATPVARAEIEPLRVEGPDAPLPSRDFSFSPLCDPPITEAVSSGRKALRATPVARA